MKVTTLTHLTLNTGHSRQSPLSEVTPAALAALQPLVYAGGGIIPGQAPRGVCITPIYGGAVFSVLGVHSPKMPLARPVVTCGLAWQPDAAAVVWDQMEALYFTVSEAYPALLAAGNALPEQPALPWLAVLLLPALAFVPTTWDWLGDFERCLAWAIMTTIVEDDRQREKGEIIIHPRQHRAEWIKEHPEALVENGGLVSQEDLERFACDICMAELDPDKAVPMIGGLSLCGRCAAPYAINTWPACQCAGCQDEREV